MKNSSFFFGLFLAVTLFVACSDGAPATTVRSLRAKTTAIVDRNNNENSDAIVNVKGEALCPLCEKALPTLLDGLQSNATSSELEKILVKACDLIPFVSSKIKTECEQAAKELPSGIAKGEGSLLSKYSIKEVCAVLGLCNIDCCLFPDIPEQIHLSLVGAPGMYNSGDGIISSDNSPVKGNGGHRDGGYQASMRVSWVTLLPLKGSPSAQWDVIPPIDGSGFNQSSPTLRRIVSNETWTYTQMGWNGNIHAVTLTGLTPGQKYYYLVGDSAGGKGWSQSALSFVAPKQPGVANMKPAQPVKIVAIADAGVSDVSDMTFERIAARRLTTGLDLLVHFGDISYADMRQHFWDEYMRKVEPVCGTTPCMTTPGNHESLVNFAAYRARLGPNMPGGGEGGKFYYSFDFGPAHFISLNTEATEDFAADIAPGTDQYNFIAKDLAAAAANRAAVPWIIVTTHRPFYCSNGGSHSRNPGCSIVGPRLLGWLEPLFAKFSVDLVLSGHRHDYEATWPVAQGKVTQKEYNQPKSPVYVVTGNAGCDEHLQGFTPDKPDWSRARFKRYGFTALSIDAKSLSLEHYSSDTGLIMDSFNITKA